MALEELARVKLKKMQGLWDKTRDDIKSMQFKTRKQLIYIEGVRSVVSKKDETPYIVFEISGAEEDNKQCKEDVLFRVSDDFRDHQSIQRFLAALGIDLNFELERIDDAVKPILNKVFEAKVEAKPSKGRIFLNVEPIRFKGGAVDTTPQEEEDGDAPF